VKATRIYVCMVAGALCAGAAALAQTSEVQKAANANIENLAQHAPRGFYPRGFSGEQVYWTVVGIDGGADSGLLSEDGALEIGKGGFSIEPFLIEDGKSITWADVESTHSLRESYLPIPSVVWKHDALSLRVTAFGAGGRERSELIARYEVRNESDRARDVTLALAVRPFQVDPSTQFLNAPGGVSPIHDLAWRDSQWWIDGKPRVFLLQRPDVISAMRLEDGLIVARLAAQRGPNARSVHDAAGFASRAALYRLHLLPHMSETIGLVAPLSGAVSLPEPGENTHEWLDRQQDAVASQWREKLNRVSLQLPQSARPLADSLRSPLAWILISRDGAELRPGTRSYARSWIRDGAMMADALLRLGHADAARDYALWYAPYQFPDGKPPCCVDARGADPTIENDSPGEFLHLVAQTYRYTGDPAFLRTMWPHVQAAVSYMQGLRMSERTPEYRAPDKKMFYGLLPASISHEGYSAHPQHSYWDDFWGLTGYMDAVAIAQALDENRTAAQWSKQRDQFRDDLYASIRASVAAHGIDFIPGSAELGDYDPTSITIALAPGGELADLRNDLPSTLLHDTFERYWRESAARAEGTKPWDDYTPYEWRNVGVFVRLGWRARIPAMLDFFFAGQRPQGWNQWAEVVGRDPRKPRFIGDLPHAWVASDYIRSLLDLFAYERETERSLVLGAGVQPAWMDGEGIVLRGLRTPYGTLSYSLKRDHSRVVWKIDVGPAPPGGMVLTWPLQSAAGKTVVNGQVAQWSNGELRVRALPATIEVEMTGASLDARLQRRAARGDRL